MKEGQSYLGWDTSWLWAIACRKWEFQWTFLWYNYEIRTKLVQHHFKFKPCVSFYIAGRGFLTLLIYEDLLLYCLPFFFRFCSLPPNPPLSISSLHTLLFLLPSLATKWMTLPHFVILYYFILWIYTCVALVPKY